MQLANLNLPSGAQRPALAAMSACILALTCLAVLTVHESAVGRRTVLGSDVINALDPQHNPFAGTGRGGLMNEDAELVDASDYDKPVADIPGRLGSWAWATTKTEDGDTVYGHDKDWIVGKNQDGWENPGHTLKGSAGYYYNEWDQDVNMQPQADVMDERSNPDHTTTLPYTAAASEGETLGPEATNYILNWDEYLAKSNGIY